MFFPFRNAVKPTAKSVEYLFKEPISLARFFTDGCLFTLKQGCNKQNESEYK